MRAISTALGSFFLASLIVTSTAFYLYLNEQTLKVLSLYLETISSYEKNDDGSVLFSLASFDKYYVNFVKPLNYSCSYGRIPDLILRKDHITFCSDKGIITLLFSFKNVSYHEGKYKLEMDYRLFSDEETNSINISAVVKEKKIKLVELEVKSSSFSTLSISLDKITEYLRDSNEIDILLTISSNKTNFIKFDLVSLYIKILNEKPHFLILYLYNLSTENILLNFVLVFNSTDVEIFDMRVNLFPLTLYSLKIKTFISNPLIKIITEKGSQLIRVSN